ncbi:MAG: hypothetical protein ACRC36_22900, partial [Lacrimispora sphenoides]
MWKSTKKKNIYLSGLLLCLTFALSACKGTGIAANSPAETQLVTESSSAGTGETAKAEKESSKETQNSPAVQDITDHGGRKLELPAVINRVYSTSPIGTMLMYTFDDKMVAGVNVNISDEEKAYLTEYYTALPNLGGWYGKGNQGN